MRIGLALPHYQYPGDPPLTWGTMLEAGVRAEALGFDSGWISDHFFFDVTRYGGPAGDVPTVEPFTTLAALAARTERIRLGTLVACATFRHPAHVAKMATTLDLASGGRFDLGLGAGWFEPEFTAFGYEFPPTGERFAVLEETVEVVTALLGGGPVDHLGAHFELRGAYNHPRPAGDGPPVWVGGKGGARLLRLVARRASGFNTVWRWSVEDYAGRVRALRETCEREGRDPATVRLSVGLYSVVGESRDDLASRWRAMQGWMPGVAGGTVEDFARGTLTGTVDECVERLAAFAELGVEELIVSPAPLPFAVPDWSMVELIAEQVLPRAASL